jgi:hypothetical protein
MLTWQMGSNKANIEQEERQEAWGCLLVHMVNKSLTQYLF